MDDEEGRMDDAEHRQLAAEKTIKAGKILSSVREQARSWVKPGVKLEELADKIESAIRSKGAEPAFPANLSVNNSAAHFTPSLNDEALLGKNDMIKVDIGAHIDGFVTDSAITIDLSGKHQQLIAAAKNALDAAIALCKPGVLIRDISAAIEKEIVELGFRPIENLTGHGISQFIVHDDPAIPNVRHSSSRKLEENQIIAIEPFATDGRGRVKDSEQHLIFTLSEAKPVRNPVARRIIQQAAQYNGLPFAERWVQRALNASAFSFRIAMKELLDNEILKSYPVLKEQEGSQVAQFEHTIIVQEEPVVVTK